MYAFGGVLLLGILAADRRRHDTPRSRAIFVGLLTALTLVLSPVTHGFYFITLLPLLAGLADRWMSKCTPASERTILALILGLFMFADIFRQIPPISDFMKDLGLPLLILLALMAVGALVLEREGALEITVTEIEQKEPSACSWRELRARH